MYFLIYSENQKELKLKKSSICLLSTTCFFNTLDLISETLGFSFGKYDDSCYRIRSRAECLKVFSVCTATLLVIENWR